MKNTLRPGLEGTFRYRVPASKTVPRIYPEAPDFQLMPAVFATGYLVALAEWACVELVKPHLDWPREQSLGTHERHVISAERFMARIAEKQPA